MALQPRTSPVINWVNGTVRRFFSVNHEATAVTIDMIIEQGTLTGILEESAAEVNSLTEALRF